MNEKEDSALSLILDIKEEVVLDRHSKAVNTVESLLKELEPKDPFEAMLACRMIALHYTEN